MSSHKSSPKKTRTIQAPQRSNGKLRVAAILDAASAVIAEKGYEAATMVEIATRSGTKIGSLYRFFPNKESLADTIVVTARGNLDTVFDKFDAAVEGLSVRALADNLVGRLVDQVFAKPALMKLMDASVEWSVKRGDFKAAALRRIAKTLVIHSPNLSQKSADDIAHIVLHNAKVMATHPDLSDSVLNEFREMTRLFLQSKLRSGRKSISA